MTKTSSQNPYADYASDEIVYIPRKHIHPDPDQPRVNADAELRASIESQGIIQAITVRPHPAIGEAFLIVDGERRYNGAVALAEIPCRIRLDLEDDADRLVTQITANTGKPLSPIEQARAFKKILDADEKLTQVELAKRLGLPRTTVGDRIRLLEIHPAWVQLIEEGKLQLSHAPAMHRFREVPEKCQLEAVQRLLSKGTGYGLGHDIAKGEPIRIDLFESRIRDCFRPFMRPVSDLPGYKGPTVEFKDWDARRKYAVDPDQWKPIRNAQMKRAKEKRKKEGGGTSSSTHSSAPRRPATEVTIGNLAAVEGVRARATKAFSPKPAADEVEVYGSQGWAGGIDPETLLASAKPEDFTIIKSSDKYARDGGIVVVPRAAAVAAQEAYRKRATEAIRRLTKKAITKLTPDAVRPHAVVGPGALALTSQLPPLDDWDNSENGTALALGMIAYALGVEVEEYQLKNGDWSRRALRIKEPQDAERVLSVYAASLALNVDWPDGWDAKRELDKLYDDGIPFKLVPAKSKNEQKRDARARGEKVGDPTRAPVPRARQFEEELVGA